MAILLGVLSALFFSLTFILNQMMSLSVTSWAWTASLRFLFMFPLFGLVVAFQRNNGFKKIVNAIKSDWKYWMVWSNVGFSLFYIPMCFASTLVPAWMIASSWQITIIAGSVIAPIIEENKDKRKKYKLSVIEILSFLLILLGITLLELHQITLIRDSFLLIVSLLLMVISAFSYPLGNRKILKINKEKYLLNTAERILAMIVCTIPVWIVCSILGYFQSGLPSRQQLSMGFSVAFFSGFIATYLFFYATQRSHENFKQLSTVETTQSLEIVFTIVLGNLFLKEYITGFLAFTGIFFVLIGMIWKSLHSDVGNDIKTIDTTNN
ncbi:multidrug resistance efflux transporter family protein [Lactococcus lactis]|uniref:Multidrug resistance efflux transporter family protein n=1 Tax=Lactococcus lactis TaxID=1358 RepID=A0A9X4NJ19_9LACT|nr:multidrug resistance efflux transporter family protein [Lactococcus lactis]MDG4985005.1 multidrug resistance efflux transporter family protein [Lactococcus lactis]